MAEVTLISTSTVVTKSSRIPNMPSQIELTPWDLQLLLVGPIQKGILFLKPKTTTTNIIDNLKNSLSLTLQFFPLLAGRLQMVQHNEENASFFIDCNNAGALFLHAIAESLTVSDIVESLYVPRVVHSFFPLNGVLNYEGVSKPLLAVQVTELADGFFIGCSMNHVVGDGTSFWHFLNAWSEISRGGLEKISQTPSLERWFPQESDKSCSLYPLVIPFNPEEHPVDNKFLERPQHLGERVFHFPKEKIFALKAKANTEVSLGNCVSVSSLQALLAHVWRSVVRCQSFATKQEARIVVVVGARPRLKPSLPEGYFGNAIQGAVVTAMSDEVVEKALGWASREINKMIALQTDEQIREFFMSWVKNPVIVGLGKSVDVSTIVIGSSPRFDVYGNDFGWGRPVAVRSGAANKSYGKLTLFTGAEQGSIDIEVCFPTAVLAAMGDDEEFMEAVGF